MSEEARQSLRLSLRGISKEEMAIRRQATFIEIMETEENYVKDLQLGVEVRTLFYARRYANALKNAIETGFPLFFGTNTPNSRRSASPC